MVSARAKPLAAVDLMKLYGKIHFTWNLRTDHLVWNGPINKLFGTDYPLSTGSSFLTRLTTASFWKRFNEIDSQKEDQYTTSYAVTLPNQLSCNITETATIIRNKKGLPERLEGSIKVCDDERNHNQKDFSGYDQLTGFPSREVLLENLTCLVEQTKGEIAPGGYLVFCIDKLSLIYFLYGLEALKDSLSQFGTTLKKFTRFNDTIGRVSGCCFGSTLKDIDEWGVFQAAHRLVDACSSIKIKSDIETFSPSISVGGSAFRDGVLPIEIIRQAEQGLFEMQNMKGTGITIQQSDGAQIEASRPKTTEAGKRRLADAKNSAKKASSEKAG
jgi:diguanylate cyclase (GGDEF)-like protein